MVAGSCDFYEKINEVFEAAKTDAPSVVFIDDADVSFEGESERGFYRYLLTMLDGLKSASAERVCVMITAMSASSLPAAMLRSGPSSSGSRRGAGQGCTGGHSARKAVNTAATDRRCGILRAGGRPPVG